MYKYDVISDYPHLCGESPMWDCVKNEFWWSDMLAGVVYRYNPENGRITEEAKGKNVSGFTMKKGGGLVCACHQGLYIWDERKGYTLIADKFGDDILSSNDATADAKGRFLFGTTFYGPGCTDGNYTSGKLFKVEKDCSISVLDEGICLSNGLGFSPDNKILYYTDTVPRIIYAYDYNLDKGTVLNRRIFVKIPDDEGIPDGMTVDAEGYVWSAQWYGGCIVRYDPDGKVERRVNTPAKQTSSIVFGGKDLTDIYVTTAAKSVTLHVAPKGYDFDAPDVGGPVYRYNFGIKGIAEYQADIGR